MSFYADSKGYPTVGYGHLITSKETFAKNTTGNPNDSVLSKTQAASLVRKYKLSYSSPISIDKAESLFLKDVAAAVNTVNNLDLPTGCILSQYQFDALVSIVFNSGKRILDTDDMQAMLKESKIFA